MGDQYNPIIAKKIISHISQNPGISFHKIVDFLDIDILDIRKNLNSLEEKKEIYTVYDNGKIKYYIKKRRKGRRGARKNRTSAIRNNIFEIIKDNPGLNLSTIAEKLNMSPQLAEYHLLYLKRNNLIVSIKKEGEFYRRFYLKESEIGVKEKELLALLRQEHLLKVILVLLKKSKIKHQKLADLLEIHPSTLTHHLNKLDEYGLIEAITYGKEKGYILKDRKHIIKLIRSYVVGEIAEGFRDLWEDLDPRA